MGPGHSERHWGGGSSRGVRTCREAQEMVEGIRDARGAIRDAWESCAKLIGEQTAISSREEKFVRISKQAVIGKYPVVET